MDKLNLTPIGQCQTRIEMLLESPGGISQQSRPALRRVYQKVVKDAETRIGFSLVDQISRPRGRREDLRDENRRFFYPLRVLVTAGHQHIRTKDRIAGNNPVYLEKNLAVLAPGLAESCVEPRKQPPRKSLMLPVG